MTKIEVWENSIDDLELVVSWDPGGIGMDTDPGPDKAHYTLWVDGVLRTITELNSSAGSRMRCKAVGAAAVIGFRLQLTTVDPGTWNLNGVVAPAPQERSLTL
jgi:hypothetical protein